MTWRDRTDMGTELIAQARDGLRVPAEWSVDLQRGFIWWAEEFAQHVRADVGNFQNAQCIFRLHAETDLIKGQGRGRQFELSLMSAMRDATMSALFYDQEKDTYKLHCSMYATSDNSEWLGKLFLGAAALQVAEAHEIGHHLAREIKAVPAVTEHPDHGLRREPDPILRAVEQFVKPYGEQPSRWIDQPEWKETEWAMERQALKYESDHRSYLQAQFAWSLDHAATSMLHVTTEEPHPHLGHGLMFRLRLPVQFPPDKCAHTAITLNGLEVKEWLRCQLVGSWCYDEGVLEFEAFVPNSCYQPEILESIALSMAIRAEWVSDKFASWFQAAQPAVVSDEAASVASAEP
jgi:hypothetical protein